MTYKTRQEVLRAAADWMDVCEKAQIVARVKWGGATVNLEMHGFHDPSKYEFPLALLEGKEVWVGSELYDSFGCMKVIRSFADICGCSWNQPTHKTAMVELPTKIVEFRAGLIELNNDEYDVLCLAEDAACKKALESLE